MIRRKTGAREGSNGSRTATAVGRHIGRRDFIRKGSVSLAGAGLSSLMHYRTAAAQPGENSTVVLVKHDGATNERGVGRPDVVKKLVDRAVFEFTGKGSSSDAWRQFVAPDDIVGIKINCIAQKNFSTQKCVVDAIVDGIKSAGVKPHNIIVWDRWNWEMKTGGYDINTSGQGVQCYGSDGGSFDPAKTGRVPRNERTRVLKKFTGHCYAKEPTDIAGVQVYLSKLLLERMTALINVPLVKDHRTAGVTCAMKNHYGSIINPHDLHGSNCDPYIPHLNLVPAIRDKTRLIVTDFLRAVYNGGPGDSPDRWRQNAVMVSTDSVAMDSVALRFVEAKRKENRMPAIGERARYVATAAKLGLGTNDPARIDLREIDITTGA
jgi:uncharacterized protein (DUF362 family)